ncbi:MAG: DNA-binding MarR family transcriptional regulator [Planctomycetota bacterium]|jgi:DNA-binding MarR family transcriptional regulator
MKEIPLDEFVTFQLLRLTNQFSRQATKLLLIHTGLRLPEWRCLSILGAYGPQHINQIVARLSADKGLISRSLTSLENSSYVRMKRNTVDRRQIIVTLSAKGRKTLKLMMPIIQHRHSKLVANLTKQDREMLSKIMAKLHKASMLVDEEMGIKNSIDPD